MTNRSVDVFPQRRYPEGANWRAANWRSFSRWIGAWTLVAGLIIHVASANAQGVQTVQTTSHADLLRVPPRRRGPDLRLVFRDDVARAEALGASYPRAPGSPRNERRCADANSGGSDGRGLGIVRSGEFRAGPFAAYEEIWHHGGAKLWFEPDLPDTSMALTVEAHRLDKVADQVTYRQARLSVDATGRRFYATTDIHLPDPGSWQFVVHAGKNWGCFLFSFQ